MRPTLFVLRLALSLFCAFFAFGVTAQQQEEKKEEKKDEKKPAEGNAPDPKPGGSGNPTNPSTPTRKPALYRRF